MGWSKSDYKGKVCWEQNGQRVFDTADIEKLENSLLSPPLFEYNIGRGIRCVLFLLGVFIGAIIGIALQ